MTFAEMQAETFRRLNESANVPVFFSVADVQTALNEGYAELSDATEWKEQWLELVLLNNRPYYDLFTILGDNFLGLGPVFHEGANRWLTSTPARILDRNDRRWEYVAGIPQRFFMRGLRWLGLFPRVQADLNVSGQLVKIYYTALPDPLVEDADAPGFPDTFHVGCIEFALTDLWAQDGETELAVAAWGRYLSIEAALGQWVAARSGRTLTTGIAGGGPWTP